eukprot:gene2958-5809_t
MIPAKKKTVIVVKEIKVDGPKKGIYVSRAVKEKEAIEGLSPTHKNTISSQQPIRNKDGSVVSRSVLGDPSVFEHIEQRLSNQNSSTDQLGRTSPMAISLFSIATARAAATRLQTATGRLMTVGSKRALTASQTQALLNPYAEPQTYLSTLKHLQDKSYKIRAQETSKESAMSEYLPVNERFSLNKEGKVMTRWQERQRAWKRIQTGIAKKLNAKGNSLLMATTDEYRAKVEEYDLLQAAIPPHERHGTSTWEMQLRGGGEISVPVGHIFSGLFCAVKDTRTPPMMVRKAKIVDHDRKKLSYIDETPAIKATRNRLHKSLEVMRPYDLNIYDAEALLLKTTDLFEWAQKSAKEAFDKKSENKNAAETAAASLIASLKAKHDHTSKIEPDGPAMTFLSPREVVFSSISDEIVHKTISFTNTGTTMLSYRWRVAPDKSQGQVTDITQVINNPSNKLRAHILSKERMCFFCNEDTGQALPGETVNTVFTFSNRTGGGGIMTQNWMLDCTPKCAVTIYSGSLSRIAIGGGGAGSEMSSSPGNNATAVSSASTSTAMLTSPLHVKLRSQTTVTDTTSHKRAMAENQLDRLSVRTFIQEIITQCVLRVRSPVTVEQIKYRRVEYFKNINGSLLCSLSDIYKEWLPIFINYDRYVMFTELYLKSKSFTRAVHSRLVELRGEKNYNEVESEESIQKRLKVRDTIFPFKKVEIFDEIDEEVLRCPWDVDMTSLLEQANGALLEAIEISEIEAESAARAAKEEKQRIKAIRMAEDSDYEEDEEEEEEDDENSKANKPLPIEHSLVKYAKALLSECKGKLGILMLRPLPDVSQYSRNALIRGLDMMDDIAQNSRRDAQLNPTDIIPPHGISLDNSEGIVAWTKLLQGEEEDKSSKKKDDKSSQKPKKNKEGSVATELQTVLYRRGLYQGLNNELLNACSEELFSAVDAALDGEAEYAIAGSVFHDLHKFGVLRADDVRGSSHSRSHSENRKPVVFLSFEGGSFLNKTAPSAFQETEVARNRAVSPIVQCAEYGASAIVLLYEDNYSSSVSGSEDTEKDKEHAMSMSEEDWSLVSAVPLIKTKLDSISQIAIDIAAKKAMRKKKGLPAPIAPPRYRVERCASMADLIASLTALSASSSVAVSSTDMAAGPIIPVLVLDTICHLSKLVPDEPKVQSDLSDDDEAPIVLGLHESIVKKEEKFKALAPRKMRMETNILGSKKEIECYTDVYTALVDLIATTEKSLGGTLWIDSNPKIFFHPKQSVLSRISPPGGRVLSQYIKQNLQWAFMMGLLAARNATELRALTDTATATATASGTEEEKQKEISPAALRFSRLFPMPAATLIPRFTVVLGGMARSDKFAVIDRLLDQIQTLIVVGELSLPFLALAGKVTLHKHLVLCADYREVCLHLNKKARMRGVRIVLPEDLIEGDEAPKATDRMKCFENIDPDSRDEGSEYEGEIRLTQLFVPPQSTIETPTDKHHNNKKLSKKGKDVLTAAIAAKSAVKPVDEKFTVSGYVLDVGPKTCRNIQDEVANSDMLLCWGAVGFCEFSGFQTGQKTLVKAAAKKARTGLVGSDSSGIEASRKPLQTVIIGQSTVEWWSRIVDPDGEKGGDLVRYGIVAYAVRDSTLTMAILGLCACPAISGVLKREPLEDEWMLDPPPPVIEEEEEEDDDDDDEEEDEDD